MEAATVALVESATDRRVSVCFSYSHSYAVCESYVNVFSECYRMNATYAERITSHTYPLYNPYKHTRIRTKYVVVKHNLVYVRGSLKRSFAKNFLHIDVLMN